MGARLVPSLLALGVPRQDIFVADCDDEPEVLDAWVECVREIYAQRRQEREGA